MMVSMITAVLPVWRSPMISSRWPRPIGISASIALRPVCIGSWTDLRGMMPGAFTSTRRRSSVAIGPLPSSGLPSASTTRPSSASPTGTSTMAPVRATVSPSRICAVVAEDHDADVVGLEVQRHAAQAGAGKLHHLAGHAVLQAEHAGDAVTDRQHLAGLGDVGLGVECGDLLLQDLRDLGGADLHIRRLPSWRTAGAAGGISRMCRRGGRRYARRARRAGRAPPTPTC